MEEDLRERLRQEIDRQLSDLDGVSGGSEEEAMIIKNIATLTDQVNKLNQTEMDVFDKQERRIAETEKNQHMHDLEVEKSKLKIDRVLFEGGKIVIPGLLSWLFYSKTLDKILKYEETGRITTDGGRMASRLPNLFSFFKK